MNSEPFTQYIYGVIPASAHLSAVVGSPLADDTRAQARFLHTDKLSGDEIIGQDGLRAVCHEDLAAVVSQSQPVDITRMRHEALAQLLVRHQKTIEAIMQSVTTVIPFRLGTCAASDQEVMDILAKGQSLIRRIFSETSGKIEMDVVATWADFASVLKEAGEDEEIKKCKQAINDNHRAVTVDDQMKIGVMIKQALDLKRNDLSRQIIERLAPETCAQSQHENMNDQMILNSAFLIEAARRPEFERALDELDARFAGKLEFRCVGPLPPYSFYTLELKRILWEDVDWARRIMGLGDAASTEEIKKAFQHSVKAAHPDHCGQNAVAEAAFKEIDGARRILQEYAQVCEQMSSTPRIVFSEESVRQNSLLVKVRNGGGTE